MASTRFGRGEGQQLVHDTGSMTHTLLNRPQGLVLIGWIGFAQPERNLRAQNRQRRTQLM